MSIAEYFRLGTCTARPDRPHPVRRLLLMAMMSAVPIGAAANTGDSEISERWRLWNDCEPVSIRVAPLAEDTRGIGLTENMLRTTVENRLRGAGIHDGDADVHAWVRVSVVGNAFSVRVLFRPRVHRPGLGSAFVTTWGMPATGIHGHDIGHVLDVVAERSELFADEYLRINADACG